MKSTEDFSVYLLQSEKSGIYYVGIAQDVNARLKEHNRGKSKFTKGHIPWELIYQEYVGNIKLARKKEKYYKSASGKKALLKRILKE